MEAVGDITASAEVSRVEVDGLEFDSRIQGGILVSLFFFEMNKSKNILYTLQE